MAPITVQNLRRLLQTLPQELYDEIYDLTCAIPEGQEIEIDGAPLTPPAILEVDGDFARRYYSNNTFLSNDVDNLIRWVRSLPSGHVELLRDVRFDFVYTPVWYVRAGGTEAVSRGQENAARGFVEKAKSTLSRGGIAKEVTEGFLTAQAWEENRDEFRTRGECCAATGNSWRTERVRELWDPVTS